MLFEPQYGAKESVGGLFAKVTFRSQNILYKGGHKDAKICFGISEKFYT
jgi:hypothetical protein